MTPRQQQAYLRQHLRFHRAEERAAVRVVLAYFSRLYSHIDQAMTQLGPTVVLGMIDGMVTETDHRRLLANIYLSTGLKTAERQYTRLRPTKSQVVDMLTKDRGGPDPTPRHHPESGTWTQRLSKLISQSDTAKRVRDMATRTADLIKSVLSTAIGAGLAVSEISRQLRDTIVSKTRAQLIGRTEVTRAANAGAEIGAATTGLILYKRWVALRDDRTRYDHAEMNSKRPIKMAALFEVGDRRMMYPGDPSGGAKQVCHCRCICLYDSLTNLSVF